MKVLRTIPDFQVSAGPKNQALRISSELEKRGISSPILTSNFMAKTSPNLELVEGVRVQRFRDIGGYMKYRFVPGIIFPSLQEDYDLIHAHGYRNFITDFVFLMSKLRSIPFILHCHGMLKGYDKFLKKKYPYLLYDMSTFKFVAKKANALIVSTRPEFNECVEFGIDKNKVHIIPAGIDVNEYDRTVVSRDADKKRVLFVGNISRDRNVEQILEAFKSLLKRMQNIELHIVGGEFKRSYVDEGGYLAELKMLTEKLDINNNVKFLGPMYGKNLIKAYKSADVFVYTSFYENFGHTVLEAAASALPIISTPVGIANDIVKDDETGYLVGYDPQEVTDKLFLLLKNDEKRKNFGKKIFDVVKRDYRWKEIIDKYVALYDMLLKRDCYF